MCSPVLLSMQAIEIIKAGPNETQDTSVSKASKQLPPYKGTNVSRSYLEHGEGIWWQEVEDGYI